MTDQTDAERRAEINRIRTMWPAGFTDTTAGEYRLALSDLPPAEISFGISMAMRTRTTRPSPAQLRELIEQGRAEAQAKRRAERPVTEGAGCPHCRHNGTRGEWVNGSSSLAYCVDHDTAWRGQVHEDHDPLGGDVLPDDIWMSKALSGEYGTVIRNVAERRVMRAEPTTDATPIGELVASIRNVS